MELKGTVTESTGSRYKILTPAGEELDAVLRGRIRLSGKRSTNPLAVGDVVSYEVTDEGGAVITALGERRNYMIRRASNLSKESHIIAANIDRALLVVTLSAPVTKPEFIDRFLVTCEAYHIPVSIVLNKDDLTDVGGAAEFERIYSGAGYDIHRISALGGEGVERLRELTRDKVTLLAGNSGVGKSTLIKVLEPSAQVKIGKISEHHNKGMHTTTFARMYPLAAGGYVIDTPGIKGFGLIDIDEREVFRYFPEFMALAPGCQYYNCTHTHEPGCAVVSALRGGELAPSRYESYLKILDEDGKYRA